MMKFKKKNKNFVKVKIYDVYNRTYDNFNDINEPILYINLENILYMLEYDVYAKIITTDREFNIYKQYLNLIKQITNVEEQIY